MEFLKEFDLDNIIPYKNNPRDNKDAVAIITESLKRFGFINPIIIDQDNIIIAGHTRYLAAKKLQMAKVPVLRVNQPQNLTNAYRIADNKTAEFARWDFAKLHAEIAVIDWQGLDPESWGLEIPEIEELASDLEAWSDILTEFKDKPTSAAPITKAQGYFELKITGDKENRPEGFVDFIKHCQAAGLNIKGKNYEG